MLAGIWEYPTPQKPLEHHKTGNGNTPEDSQVYLEQQEGGDDVVGHVEIIPSAGFVQGEPFQGEDELRGEGTAARQGEGLGWVGNAELDFKGSNFPKISPLEVFTPSPAPLWMQLLGFLDLPELPGLKKFH